MGAGERLPGSSTHPYLQHTPSSSSFQFQTVSFTPPTCFFSCTSPSSSNPYLQYDAKPLPPESVFQTGAKHQTAGQRPQARTGAIGTGVRTDGTGHPQALDCQLQAETRSIAEESQAEPRYVAVSYIKNYSHYKLRSGARRQ